MSARRLAAVLAVAALACGVSAAPAAASSGAATIGGPLLASHGVVVQPRGGAPALPAPSALPASSWLVANLTTGDVLAAKAPHERFLPASTLKTLTAVTLLPRLDANRRVMVTQHDAGVDGSKVGLVPGMRYTVHKLFQCMLVVSANDAADALAQANGGTAKTLRDMNATARYLQADDTVAKTPSGLDGQGESSSAYDLALIARAGLQLPAFRKYIGTVRSRVPAPHHKHFQIYTHNYLLTSYHGAIGVKNGYTVAAQGTYIGAATRGGQTILVTLMHANPDFWPMARALLTWGFRATGKVTPVGTLVGPRQPATHSAPAAAPAVQLVGHHSGFGVSPLTFATTGVVFVAAGAVITRRRQVRRRRLRYRLPQR